MATANGDATLMEGSPLNETEAPNFGKDDLLARKGDTSGGGKPAARFGRIGSTVRMLSFCVYFSTGCILIVLTQLIGSPLYLVNKPLFYAWMARTKQHFGILVTTITQWWAPTVIRVTGDKTVRHQLKRAKDGRLECDFPERMVLIANHQIYSDWLYLWWIAYTARMHGFIYIILKESLKFVPILGFPGMMFYGFIFLARNWAKDKPRFEYRLNKLTKKNDPLWLLIFPEGTNASANGRAKSKKFAESIHQKDFQHLLHPRTTGLRFCLETLGGKVEWLYDCTVAYEGVPRGEFGQDLFTLSSMYFSGQPPKSVNMHWRRFRISEIPYTDPAKFEVWMRKIWAEKDQMMEDYLVNGYFEEDSDDKDHSESALTGKEDGTEVRHRTKMVGGRKRTMKIGGGTVFEDGKEVWQGPIETEVALKHWWECFDVVTVVATVVMLWRLVGKWWGVLQGFQTHTGEMVKKKLVERMGDL